MVVRLCIRPLYKIITGIIFGGHVNSIAALKLAEIIEKIGLPPGAVNVITRPAALKSEQPAGVIVRIVEWHNFFLYANIKAGLPPVPQT